MGMIDLLLVLLMAAKIIGIGSFSIWWIIILAIEDIVIKVIFSDSGDGKV